MEIVQLPGLTPYEQAWELQHSTHDDVVAGQRESVIYLLEHPPVYTAGRRTHASEFPTNGTQVLPVDRGGKITWHGPGQLVAYPIIKLREPIDVIEFLRRLESAVIDVCAEFGLAAVRVQGRSGVWLPTQQVLSPSFCAQSQNPASPQNPSNQPAANEFVEPSAGVFEKVCAVGARVARNVTMHGLALNCNPNLDAFNAIVPCGIDDAAVTSLTKATGQDVTVTQMRPRLAAALITNLTPQLAT